MSRMLAVSLVVCGLFVAEDPVVLAVRDRIDGSWSTRLIGDAALAAVMICYNYAASRFVVSVVAAPHVLLAMATVNERRNAQIAGIRRPGLRRLQRILAHMNPFELLKSASERCGAPLDRIAGSAGRRDWHYVAVLLRDLGAVNVLGVPGAGLALSGNGRPLARGQSARHCVLFVGSWFFAVGVLELLIRTIYRTPVIGTWASAGFGIVGALFSTLTDMSRPLGMLGVAAITASVLRYAIRVDRAAHSDPG